MYQTVVDTNWIKYQYVRWLWVNSIIRAMCVTCSWSLLPSDVISTGTDKEINPDLWLASDQHKNPTATNQRGYTTLLSTTQQVVSLLTCWGFLYFGVKYQIVLMMLEAEKLIRTIRLIRYRRPLPLASFARLEYTSDDGNFLCLWCDKTVWYGFFSKLKVGPKGI